MYALRQQGSPEYRDVVACHGISVLEQHDEWIEGRRYLGLDVLLRCRIRLVPGHDIQTTATEEVTISALSA